MFEPLGWTVEAEEIPLDDSMPGWRASRYVDLRLTGTQVLAQALSHLYVLLPVLDGVKHYWVDEQEVDKLVRASSTRLTDEPSVEVASSGDTDAVPVPRPRLGAARVQAVVETLRAERAGPHR